LVDTPEVSDSRDDARPDVTTGRGEFAVRLLAERLSAWARRTFSDRLARLPWRAFVLLPGDASPGLPLSCLAVNVSGSGECRARVMTAPSAACI